MSRKILAVDDEQHILDTIKAYLTTEGYEVITARDGQQALFTLRHEKPDLIVLDIMMPVMDGLEAARLIRKESSVPIIFLTARVEDTDQIAGLEVGADEYISKPFSPRVLVARVRALLRRTYGDLAPQALVWRVGELEVNAETHTVTRAGQRIDLTPTEFDLLVTLISRPGRVFSRAELLDRLDDSFAAYERAVDVHIKNLRAKIETVYGVGYRLRPDDE